MKPYQENGSQAYRFVIKNVVILPSILFIWSFPMSADCGDIYKWIDEKGVIHYTDNPIETPQTKVKTKLNPPDSETTYGQEITWFRPKAPPSDNPVGSIHLLFKESKIELEHPFIRRFVGRLAREITGGMAEWWFDAKIQTTVDVHPKTFPRVFISLIDERGELLPVFYEDSGRTIRDYGMHEGSRQTVCQISTVQYVLGGYQFMGYSSRETGISETGLGLDLSRPNEPMLHCFLGCTPIDSPVAGIRVRTGTPWSEDPMRQKQGGKQR